MSRLSAVYKKVKFFVKSAVTFFTSIFLYGVAYAQWTMPNPENQLPNLMRQIFVALLAIAVIVGIILIIVSGYKIMTSEGDPRKVQEGKEGLTSAILGLLFVLGSLAIIRVLLGSLLGGGGAPF